MVIRRKEDDGILVLTLDEPARRNHLRHAVRVKLVQLLSDAEHRAELRALVLTGVGGIFSAGGEICDVEAVTGIAEARHRFTTTKGMIWRMARFPKSLVAAVDARVASRFDHLGQVSEVGLLATLTAQIGAGPKFPSNLGQDRRDRKPLGLLRQMPAEVSGEMKWAGPWCPAARQGE